jgi:hypothetical protein
MLTCWHKSNYTRATHDNYESDTIRSMDVKELQVIYDHLQKYLINKWLKKAWRTTSSSEHAHDIPSIIN